MKNFLHSLNTLFAAGALALALFVAVPALPLHAQQAPAVAVKAPASSVAAREASKGSPDSDQEEQQYTHSASVRAIARFLHLSVNTTAKIFEDLNSGILFLVIFGLLFKVVPKFLRRRAESLQKSLTDARSATEVANQRLAQVEARLSRLDSEIDAIRQQVEAEAVEDEKRILSTVEAERARIVAAAEQEIVASQAAAQRELKKFAADLAIEHAMRKIQLSSDTDRALVREFGKGLGKSGGEA